MLRNLLTVALRNIQRQRFFTLLHILGLSIGLACCILITIFTWHELSYDQFHEKADRIYRINQTFIWGDDDALFGSTGPAVKGAIGNEVPEFESMTRVYTPGSSLISYTQNSGEYVVFEEENLLAVDSNFLEVFTFPLLEGNLKTALTNPHSIILTQSMAEKYFGDAPAIGKQLEVGEGDEQRTFQVTGITRDVPENSHIQFDGLISMSSIPRVRNSEDSWIWTTFVTFGVLRPDADPAVVAEKVAAVPGKYLEAFLQKYRGISYREFLDSGEEWNLYIQPLTDIHLRSNHVYSRLNETGDIQTIYILWLIGGLVLVLSLINFVNLSTARATTRAKEVGIRKVIGSDRKMLVFQFLTESTLIVLFSAIIGLFLAELLIPLVNQTLDISLTLNKLLAPGTMVLFCSLVLFIAFLGGLYPAFYLSAFRPSEVLKGKLGQGLKGKQVRNALVTVQFAISIMMIGSTLIIYDQVNYWQNLDLGFDRENKLVIEHAERLGTSVESFKNEILSNPMVEQMTLSSDTPPIIFDFDNFEMRGVENKQLSVNYLTGDEHFTDVFGLQLTHGRGLSKAFNDSTNVVVNEALTRSFGFSDPKDALNQHITYYEQPFRIVGIISDFNTSLSSQTYPFALFGTEAPIYSDRSKELTVSFRKDASADELRNLIAHVKALWLEKNPKSPFSYTFVDQDYLRVFESAIRFGKILSALSILAIGIACLGLIGLVAFVIERRNKEIGIRKVLGASVTSIWVLLSTDFGKLLILGFVLGAPCSWFLMSKWIENYPIRDELSIFTLVIAGGLMLLIAVLTTSFQTLKASRVNPVDYLREE